MTVLTDLPKTAHDVAPLNRHYQHLDVVWLVFPILPAHQQDPLGFAYERWQAGEADVSAGRVYPFDDVMNALRARVRGDRA